MQATRCPPVAPVPSEAQSPPDSLDLFTAGLTDVFDALTHQPIVDAAGKTRGYELLYRGLGDGDASCMDSGLHATSEVLCTAAFSLGLDEAGDGGKPLYVNVDGPTLLSPVVEAIGPRLGVIELLESIVVTDAVRRRVEALRARGYRFALDDVSHARDERLALLPWIDIVKIDMRLATHREVATLLALARVHGKPTLAEKLEDETALQEARRLGFDLFQGYRIGLPTPIACLRLPACSRRGVHRLHWMARNAAPAQSLATVLARDPALALRLWLLVDLQTDDGAPREVGSLRELVEAMPRHVLCAWLEALWQTTVGEMPPGDWHVKALALARFLELAAGRLAPDDLALARAAYLLGLIGHFRETLAQAFRQPAQRVRGSPAIEDAAALRTGPLGALLDLALGRPLYPPGWCPEPLASHPGFQAALGPIAVAAQRWARECCTPSRNDTPPMVPFGA